ncbi:dna-repair protein rad13 [Ophiostoma piceae UAMH 11346]|uniref:Dna-repair protein rad13 n=1 Tax=Ophiostoma piceae (strain UAMH 11346) TaxID=1262450 RepID=S3D842_OPHP1|nr:dna-repair protein rad13 [Ophiostoma piceae UAMH 11346]
MGVNGLWQVLQPCARPTNLATLNRQRLAVDASIWIYQFLKAVRDKEGNALRNSHVIGFFRRICKLLWFGILPVFVFDGGAPALKRSTLQNRRQRREGRRDDAARTAGKLLAVQMQRMAEEEVGRRKRAAVREEAIKNTGGTEAEHEADGMAPGESLPAADKLVYNEELHMTQQERTQGRKFTKKDAYHLPDLDHGSIEGMASGRPEDPRIMSIDELENYARQFHAGEDINLYDFSKIDFDGEFFKSLPPHDRYNILNAARVRSRLRMGLSKEQLDTMFPDRMAFSRFQIERVRERNHLTQRLMFEVGMTGLDLTINSSKGPGGGVGRVAGERGREYILVKNDGAEGGWALGVVSHEKDLGEAHKPIDVDALKFHYQGDEEYDQAEDDEDDEDAEFEDVPIEGLNRLPKIPLGSTASEQPFGGPSEEADEDSLFVNSYDNQLADIQGEGAVISENTDVLVGDEDEDLNRAIAMSLQNQHTLENEAENEGEDEESVDIERPAPQWTQKAAETARPIGGRSGKNVAHIVNARANSAVSLAAARAREREKEAIAAAATSKFAKSTIVEDSDSSDSELDIRAAMAKAARKKKERPTPAVITAPSTAPSQPTQKAPASDAFGGPLPFEKLDWRTSIFERKPAAGPASSAAHAPAPAGGAGAQLPFTSRPILSGQVAVDMSSPFAPASKPSSALPSQPSVFKVVNDTQTAAAIAAANAAESATFEVDSEDDFGGGFERAPTAPNGGNQGRKAAEQQEGLPGEELEFEEPSETDQEKPESLPLPPWMAHDTDIRMAVRQQRQYDEEINAEDREAALEEAKIWQKRQESRVVEIDDSSDDDIEVLDAPAFPTTKTPVPESDQPVQPVEPADLPKEATPVKNAEPQPAAVESETRSSSPEMEFEDVDIPDATVSDSVPITGGEDADLTVSEPVPKLEITTTTNTGDEVVVGAPLGDTGDDLFAEDADVDGGVEKFDISDPEDEELLVQMAEEVEEHARFASELNSRQTAASTREAQLAYEQELKALRNQQKKDRRDADEVTQVMVSECQALLKLFGIPYITAPMEAEAQCAELVTLGLVDGIVTDDSDTFLFGGTRVYKNMFNGNKYVECYISSDLDREMSLSREKLIAIAQLLGSDYTDGLPGVGPVTAMEIISEFPGETGLQDFRDWWDEVQSQPLPSKRDKEADAAMSSFRRKFRKSQATKLFLPTTFPSPAVADAYLHPDVDRSTETFQWGVPDLDGLRQFLMATIGWSQERTDEVLVPVIRDMNRREAEGTQSNITRYFTGGVGAGARLTEAQVEELEKQQRLQQKYQDEQRAVMASSEHAPRHAPRNKNGAGGPSRRLAAAVSKLKASSTVEAAATVMRAPKGPAPSIAGGINSGRKRKGRASTAALEEDEDDGGDELENNDDPEGSAAEAGGDGDDDAYTVPTKQRRTGRKTTAS